MPSEDVSKAKDFSKTIAARIKQERERRAWTQAEVAERIGSTRINVNRWENGVTTPTLYYRRRLAELFEKSVQELGFLPISSEQENEKEALSDYSTHDSHLWNVPHRRNPFFTGREEILRRLSAEFNSSQATRTPIALNGLGGIGKTQIAMEYAYHYRDSYHAIFWLNASTRDTLSSDILTLASLLGLAHQQEQEEIVVQAIKRWLMTHTNWLLILDNISSLEMIIELLPMYTLGDVLLTTRMQAVGTIAHNIPVEDMTKKEGVLFLLRRTKLLALSVSPEQAFRENWQEASEIVEELGGLPLALDQAGAYIEETRCGLAQYLHHYISRRQELLHRRGTFPIHHPDPVATTWQLSFQRIEERWPASTDLLHLCAFLDSDSIPEELLMLGAPQLGPLLSNVLKDPLELDSILEPLLSYSLIHRSPETSSLTVHRLVQTVLRQNLSIAMQEQWAKRVICALNSVFPDPKKDSTTWAQCQRLLPQVLTCVQLFEEYALFLPEAESLFERAGDYVYQRAMFARAILFFQKTLVIRESVYGGEHGSTARGLSRLGEAYRALEDYKEAEPLLLHALAIYECSLPPDILEVTYTLNALGELYHNLRRYEEAESFFQRALSITEPTGGPNHSGTLETLHHLARLYYSQRKYKEAKDIYQHVLGVQERVFGIDHFQIAVILNNLAIIYRSQGDYEQAETLLLRVLRLQEEVLGSHHFRTAQVLHNLGVVYQKQKYYEKAEDMFQHALEVKETSCGSKHSSTIKTITNLAHLYQKQKRYREAQVLLQRAIEADLGSEHPYTIVIFRNLASLYYEEENYEEAEKLYLRALAICENIFPLSYLDMKIISQSLAELYRKLNRKEEATIMEQQMALLH